MKPVRGREKGISQPNQHEIAKPQRFFLWGGMVILTGEFAITSSSSE
jgi:hypothetical protein